MPLPIITPKKFFLIALALAALNFSVLADLRFQIQPGYYFLDVGQGDSELIVGENGTKIMVDAGGGKTAVSKVPLALGNEDSYIDVGIISHPELDHYGGFREVLSRYNFGAFVWNGHAPDVQAAEWKDLLLALEERHIPLLTLGKGDKVNFGDETISVLSPDHETLGFKEGNERGLVLRSETQSGTAIFSADIDKRVEKILLDLGSGLRSDILKVAHHGSKYSLEAQFLHLVDPAISVIEVGAKNRYGHPTKEALAALLSLGSKIYRTDLDGSVYLRRENGVLKVSFLEKGAGSAAN